MLFCDTEQEAGFKTKNNTAEKYIKQKKKEKKRKRHLVELVEVVVDVRIRKSMYVMQRQRRAS